METLFYLEHYRHFRDASERARGLAVHYKQQTGVSPRQDGWEVLVPRMVLREEYSSSDEGSEVEGVFEVDSGDSDESDFQELLSELANDQEDFARSEEQGWFYAD